MLVRRRAPWVAVIVCAVILVYWNGLDAPFIWDDHTAIVDNTTIRSLWPPWNALVTPLETPVSRRPLVNLSFALNYRLHALDVRGYHAVNLAAHLLSACLLFAIIRRALSAPMLEERFRAHATPIALLATLWWAVHPLLSEVVNYTTQRTTVLAGFFLLATLYAAQRALEARRPARWHAVAALACACGVMAKEFVAVAPLVILLYDRAFAFGSFREALAGRARLYGPLACSWVILAAILILRPHSSVGFSAGVDAWTYCLNQAEMIVRYLRLALWPDALVLDYGLPQALSFRDVWPSLALVTTLFAGSVIALIRWPRVGFLCIAFFLMLAPTSSVVPIATEVGAERRMYLPLAALAGLFAVAGAWLLEGVRRHLSGRWQRPAIAGALVVASTWITALGVRTVDRNDEYATHLTVWRNSVERWPRGRPRLSYAMALLDAGQREPGIRQMRLAAGEYHKARFVLGNELVEDERYDEAIHQLSLFIAVEPPGGERFGARMLRGRIRSEQGRFDDAIAEYRALIEQFPTSLGVRERLADTLLASGQAEDALPHYRWLLERQPQHAVWLGRLADALALSGREADAEAAYRQALDVDPRATTAHMGLARSLLKSGRIREGATHAETAVALDPRSAVAHNTLGIAQAMEGRLDAAAAHFSESARLDPQYADARANLARVEGQRDARRPRRQAGARRP